MSVWDGLVGQQQAVSQLQRAATGARATLRQLWGQPVGGDEEALMRAMTHAWLVTGPPGSGRSNVARAFAAALQCEGPVPGCGQCDQCRAVMSGEHPDVVVLATDKVVISIEDVRDLVVRAQTAPSRGRWRVMIVEDADRMATRTTNTLLKAIEEPPERTVWVLCTPSPEDVLTTIRSRCRAVNLLVPPARAVADLLVSQGVTDDQQAALEAALAAQSHIGRARGLLQQDPAVRRQIRERLARTVTVLSAGQAVAAAQELSDQAKAEVAQFKEQVAPGEIERLRLALGIEPGKSVPPALHAQIREKEEEQKRRATRIERDYLDLAMLDLLSFFRDVLTVQTGAQVQLLNADLEQTVRRVAEASEPTVTLKRMDAVATARSRLAGNVAPLLALEAMIISFIPPYNGSEVFV